MISKVGLTLKRRFPKCSPDLNAIESVWHMIRQHLDDSAPVERETPDEFVKRLRRAVIWINTHKREQLLILCCNQKVRARDVLFLEGGKTKW